MHKCCEVSIRLWQKSISRVIWDMVRSDYHIPKLQGLSFITHSVTQYYFSQGSNRTPKHTDKRVFQVVMPSGDCVWWASQLRINTPRSCIARCNTGSCCAHQLIKKYSMSDDTVWTTSTDSVWWRCVVQDFRRVQVFISFHIHSCKCIWEIQPSSSIHTGMHKVYALFTYTYIKTANFYPIRKSNSPTYQV